MIDTKERILLAASREFADNGFKGTTIRSICRKARVNLASVNYHFSSKEALYRQVFDYLFEKTDIELTEILTKSSVGSFGEWRKSMEKWVKAFMGMTLSDDPLVRQKQMIICREMNDPSEIFPKIFETNIKPRLKYLETHFRKVLPEDTSDEIIYFFVFSIIAECFFYFQNRIIVSSIFPDKPYLRNNIDQFVDLITEQACSLVKNIKTHKVK